MSGVQRAPSSVGNQKARVWAGVVKVGVKNTARANSCGGVVGVWGHGAICLAAQTSRMSPGHPNVTGYHWW